MAHHPVLIFIDIPAGRDSFLSIVFAADETGFHRWLSRMGFGEEYEVECTLNRRNGTRFYGFQVLKCSPISSRIFLAFLRFVSGFLTKMLIPRKCSRWSDKVTPR